MSILHYVRCPDSACRFHGKPILLPASIPPQTDSDPQGWPIDKSVLFVACPHCTLVSAHYRADLADFPQAAQDEFRRDRVWWRITTQCGAENCTTPLEFHVLMEEDRQSRMHADIGDKFSIGLWKGATPCGHPFQASHNFRFDNVEGKLRGYDPH